LFKFSSYSHPEIWEFQGVTASRAHTCPPPPRAPASTPRHRGDADPAPSWRPHATEIRWRLGDADLAELRGATTSWSSAAWWADHHGAAGSRISRGGGGSSCSGPSSPPRPLNTAQRTNSGSRRRSRGPRLRRARRRTTSPSATLSSRPTSGMPARSGCGSNAAYPAR
jgi:hypothetical protein